MKVLRATRRATGGASLVVALTFATAVPVAAAPGVTWQNPISPGGVTAGTTASTSLSAPTISCWTPEECEAVGTYVDTTESDALFTSTEVAGTWGTATTLGAAPTAATQPAQLTITHLDCVSSGNCALAGTFNSAATGATAVFVASEASGTWSPAIALPGLATLDTGGHEQADALVCVSAGACTVAGSYVDAAGQTSIYTSSLANGSWSNAATIPTASDAGSPAFAVVSALACPAVGACTLVGAYSDESGDFQVLLDNESDGSWSTPTAVTGIVTLNSYYAQGTAVWCSVAGTCELGGTYTDSTGAVQGFVAAEASGTVSASGEIPGLAALNVSGQVTVTALECASADLCVVGGSYSPDGSNTDAFVAQIDMGTPQSATQLPGWSSLDHSTGATTGTVTNVSCSDSACAVAGTYADANGVEQVFGDNESAGTWDLVAAVSFEPSDFTTNDSSVDTLVCNASLICELVATGSTSSGAPITSESAGSDTTWEWGQLFTPQVSVLLTANAAGGGLSCWQARILRGCRLVSIDQQRRVAVG